MNKLTHNYWALAISSGFLFWLGWPMNPLPVFQFFAFIPLLWLDRLIDQDQKGRKMIRFLSFSYLAFLVWNITTTWWVWNSTSIGAIFMLLANAFLMNIPFWLFRLTRKKGGDLLGYFGFVIYWLSFEHIHLSWELSWPWLTLGNSFSLRATWIQWYEFTGVLGGSLWILLINLLIFKGIYSIKSLNFRLKPVNLVVAFLLFVIPVAYSLFSYHNYEETGEPVEVVVLQPNIDPYTEKFIGSDNFIPFEEQVNQFISLSEEKITAETDFLVWPETAIDNAFNEQSLTRYAVLNDIVTFKNKYPNLSLVTGITSYIIYTPQDATPSARYNPDIGYYDLYNTAMFIGNDSSIVTYHKSKLVPGVESMPYPQVTNVLAETIFNLGGTAGGLGRQEERTVFYNEEQKGVAPSICYESIYGDFMASFIRNGANMIFIITNDGWWGNTPGHRQHLQYARLRAIEGRKSIARSANTGISAFINQRGDVFQPTAYWTQAVIKQEILANDLETFYTRHGDYIARTSLWLSFFILLGSIVNGIINRK